MPSVKVNVSLDYSAAELLRRRAREVGKPTSRYLADLIREDDRRQRDKLAAEGYSLLSAETGAFADAALPIAAETWPEWRNEEPTRGS